MEQPESSAASTTISVGDLYLEGKKRREEEATAAMMKSENTIIVPVTPEVPVIPVISVIPEVPEIKKTPVIKKILPKLLKPIIPTDSTSSSSSSNTSIDMTIPSVPTTNTIQISTDPRQKLLPYQHQQVDNLIYSLGLYGRSLDCSDTGTGKGYMATATCMLMGLKPLIICPKSVLGSWRKVLDEFGAPYYGISNYESIQNCKYYTRNSGNNKLTCNFIERTEKNLPVKALPTIGTATNTNTNTNTVIPTALAVK
jgi:hypothetical protein